VAAFPFSRTLPPGFAGGARPGAVRRQPASRRGLRICFVEEAFFAAMGIRFSCPNGHKLHVKAFLAGKRGICPHCGAQFRVPAAETPASESSSEVLSVAEVAPPRTPPVLPAAPPVPQASVEPAPLPVFPSDPGSIWYVRPAQGGQYGPAYASVMRTWVTEGRVPPDAWVWCQGWAEWQKASAVIPLALLEAVGRSLQPAPVLAASLALSPAKGNTGPATGNTGPAKEKMATVEAYRQRQSHRRSVNLVTWLGVTSLVLVAALVYVVAFRR